MNEPMVGYAGRNRYVALWLDNVFALMLGFLSTTIVPIVGLRWVALTLVYLGYFFLFETLWSRTPCKAMFGLRVISADGSRVTAKGAAIRTVTRLVEANPFLAGAIPGAILVLTSLRKQRLGDMLGATLVVEARRR